MHLTALGRAALRLHPTAATLTFAIDPRTRILGPHSIADADGAVLWSAATADGRGITHAFATAAGRIRDARSEPRLSRDGNQLTYDLGADREAHRVDGLSENDRLRYAADRDRRDDAALYEDDRQSGRELRELRYEMRDARW